MSDETSDLLAYCRDVETLSRSARTFQRAEATLARIYPEKPLEELRELLIRDMTTQRKRTTLADVAKRRRKRMEK